MSSTTPNMGLTVPDVTDRVSKTIQDLGDNFNIIDNLWPVGSIYISTRSTNPAEFIGGTWTQISGRFLLGASSSYPAGQRGGSATHKITKSEMPSHNHQARWSSGNDWVGAWKSDVGDGDGWQVATTYSGGDAATDKNWVTITETGGSTPMSIMPPYVSVYIWERTA